MFRVSDRILALVCLLAAALPAFAQTDTAPPDVPEPVTMALLATGAVGFGLRAYRRRR